MRRFIQPHKPFEEDSRAIMTDLKGISPDVLNDKNSSSYRMCWTQKEFWSQQSARQVPGATGNEEVQKVWRNLARHPSVISGMHSSWQRVQEFFALVSDIHGIGEFRLLGERDDLARRGHVAGPSGRNRFLQLKYNLSADVQRHWQKSVHARYQTKMPHLMRKVLNQDSSTPVL